MRYAMLFPGQGSQAVGMGAELVRRYAEARAVFERADAVLDTGLSRLCFEGPIETLTETRWAQPALLVHSIAVWEVLRARGVEAGVVAGHSLGEYSALVVAGVLDFEVALELVRIRGELMFAAGQTHPGTMAAVVGLERQAVESACAAARAHGVCDLANLNAPDQLVISGATGAVRDAMARLEQAGARLVKQLNVSGAFHSALMRQPGAALAAHLDRVAWRDAAVPVVANVTAAVETRGEALRELLKQQIHSPVRWEDSMRTLRRHDGGPLLEVGSGSVLKGLLRRIDRAAACEAVGDPSGIETALRNAGAS